jgi:hypothetical protein
MSGDDKNFLSRWSQRKHEAKQPEPEPLVAEAEVQPMPVVEGEAVPEFDLASLPKLEELTANTDMTVFLRKGVPEGLRNAALSKSWALDPAIRNYVNPALEYAYDWNTPGGVPGTGELGAGMDVARMVLQIMGDGKPVEEPAPPAAEAASQPTGDPALSAEQIATQEPKPELKPDLKPDLPTQPLRLGNELVSVAEAPSETGTGTRHEGERTAESHGDSAAPQQPVRRHGSAKPLD